MSRCKEQMDIDGVDEALGKLIKAQINFGKEASKLLGAGLNGAIGALKNLNLPKSNSCCEIPEPCWMPLDLGEICCQLCTDDVAEICFIIANENFRPQSYQIFAAGEHANHVSISKNQINLGPKERRVVSAKFKIPARSAPDQESCCQCNDFEVVIWIKGCRNHYLNWYINTSEKSSDCCYEVCVTDQPDNELHWYDHFHILGSCANDQNGFTRG